MTGMMTVMVLAMMAEAVMAMVVAMGILNSDT